MKSSLHYVNGFFYLVIRWDSELPADTIRGEVVYDDKNNLVKLDKLFLNGKVVWTDQDGKDRLVVIEKNVVE